MNFEIKNLEKSKLQNENIEEVHEDVNPKSTDDDFSPPDGGWGWMIVLAAGFSQFCILPVQQSLGLIFRDKFQQLGINSSEISIILNGNLAMLSLIGLLNGPIFKKYSFRKVAFVGSFTTALSIAILSFMTTFYGILICLSFLYASGLGVTLSANALAVNTYFNKKRKIAVGLCWTFTGLGPIVMPQIVTLLLPRYGAPGTLLILSSIAFNAVACALILQPVSRHIKMIKKLSLTVNNVVEHTEKSGNNMPNGQYACTNELLNRGKPLNPIETRLNKVFGSQFISKSDISDDAPGIDVDSPATPMMSRANDGWFSERYSTISLSSNSLHRRNISQSTNNINSALNEIVVDIKQNSNEATISLLTNTEQLDNKISFDDNTTVAIKEMRTDGSNSKDEQTEQKTKHSKILQLFEAVTIFFDLDLLKDGVFVNLMLGISFANFTELNFALLTPFILAEYGLNKQQVAIIMSVLGGIDVIARFIVPFIANKFDWNNRTFFLTGIGCMAAGRFILAHTSSYNVIIAIGVLIGFGKALRTIFMALIIPSHVSLSRLPAASGLQLITSGVISFALGPAIGWIKDFCESYTILLHVLNIFTYLTIISWTLEIWIMSQKKTNDFNIED